MEERLTMSVEIAAPQRWVRGEKIVIERRESAT